MRSPPLPLLLAWILAVTVAPCLTRGVAAQGASADPVQEARLKIGASTLVGIPMVGIERPLRYPRRTFQWDVMLSPWRSVDDYPLEFLVGVAEWRFYRAPSREGWYGALHLGATVFRLQRLDYRDTTLYQEGAGLLGGASVGRVWRLRSGSTIDAYIGAGSVQSIYKGYDRLTDARYDGARLWNVSGEWLPYRTGVSLGIPWRRAR